MKLIDTVIAWTPRTNGVAVGLHPDRLGWSRSYQVVDGACAEDWHEASEEVRLVRMFVIFNTVVVRDGVPPLVAHKAFLGIEEYRQAVVRGCCPGQAQVALPALDD